MDYLRLLEYLHTPKNKEPLELLPVQQYRRRKSFLDADLVWTTPQYSEDHTLIGHPLNQMPEWMLAAMLAGINQWALGTLQSSPILNNNPTEPKFSFSQHMLLVGILEKIAFENLLCKDIPRSTVKEFARAITDSLVYRELDGWIVEPLIQVQGEFVPYLDETLKNVTLGNPKLGRLIRSVVTTQIAHSIALETFILLEQNPPCDIFLMRQTILSVVSNLALLVGMHNTRIRVLLSRAFASWILNYPEDTWDPTSDVLFNIFNQLYEYDSPHVKQHEDEAWRYLTSFIPVKRSY